MPTQTLDIYDPHSVLAYLKAIQDYANAIRVEAEFIGTISKMPFITRRVMHLNAIADKIEKLSTYDKDRPR